VPGGKPRGPSRREERLSTGETGGKGPRRRDHRNKLDRCFGTAGRPVPSQFSVRRRRTETGGAGGNPWGFPRRPDARGGFFREGLRSRGGGGGRGRGGRSGAVNRPDGRGAVAVLRAHHPTRLTTWGALLGHRGTGGGERRCTTVRGVRAVPPGGPVRTSAGTGGCVSGRHTPPVDDWAPAPRARVGGETRQTGHALSPRRSRFSRRTAGFLVWRFSAETGRVAVAAAGRRRKGEGPSVSDRPRHDGGRPITPRVGRGRGGTAGFRGNDHHKWGRVVGARAGPGAFVFWRRARRERVALKQVGDSDTRDTRGPPGGGGKSGGGARPRWRTGRAAGEGERENRKLVPVCVRRKTGGGTG